MLGRIGGGAVSSPPPDVLVGIALAAGCGTILLAGLIGAAAVMRQISRHLTALSEALVAIGASTDPLVGHVGGIAGNVRNLRAAAISLGQVVSVRSEAADARH